MPWLPRQHASAGPPPANTQPQLTIAQVAADVLTQFQVFRSGGTPRCRFADIMRYNTDSDRQFVNVQIVIRPAHSGQVVADEIARQLFEEYPYVRAELIVPKAGIWAVLVPHVFG